MKLISLLAAVIFLVTGTLVTQADTLYKTVGPDGKITYSDKPPLKGNVEKKFTFKNLPSSKLPAPGNNSTTVNNTLTSTKPVAGSVTLYTASWCGYCKQAKAYLAKQRIPYREVDIETQDGMAEFSRAGGSGAVPLLVAGKESVQGFSPEAYEAILTSL
ncbi:MAG TPA: glutaredoxin domain-containing protein [Methylophilaceae bacterium]|nr:glutaredoxin domain-containing protein [Methylophilaceae bacterium]